MSGFGFQRLIRTDRGGVAVLFAVLSVVITAAVGVGVDYGRSAIVRAILQRTVDTAALAGASAYSSPAAVTLATTLTQNYVSTGTAALPERATVTASTITPGTTGGAYTMSVNVTASVPTTFMSLYQSAIPVSVSAAAKNTGVTSACVLALDPGASGAAQISGSTVVNLNNCGMTVNSTSPSSLTVSGTLDTNSLTLGGNFSGCCVSSPIIKTYEPATPDPYASLPMPTYTGCDQRNFNTAQTLTLNPGVYCGGISLTGGANVTLSPGTYILDGGNLKVAGNAAMAGTGVTIILTSSGDASSIGSVDFEGGSIVQLSAPTSGTLAGITIWVDGKAPLETNTIAGGNANTFSGVIYMPSEDPTFSGGATSTNGCLQLVANQIKFSGTSNFSNNCAGTGVVTIAGGGVLLTN